MSYQPPSKIAAERQQQWDDLRDLMPEPPPLPAHHVRIEELYDAMCVCSLSLKGKVSLANLVDICRSINECLDKRVVQQ